jgi:glycosyltransferase involved in cell wall biosynthesis
MDLKGRKFNGYDLHLSLRKLGYEVNHIVFNKMSNTTSVTCLLPKEDKSNFSYKDTLVENPSVELNLQKLLKSDLFLSADVVHYQIMPSLLSQLPLAKLPELMNAKPSIWTIHDAWPFTGMCVQPMGCKGWLDGCQCCDGSNKFGLGSYKKAPDVYDLKAQIYHKIDVDIIVASEYIKSFLQQSPLSGNFSRVHRIPFGADVEFFSSGNQYESRERLGISHDDFVLAFRYNTAEIKGRKYIEDSLTLIDPDDVTLLTCDEGVLPHQITQKFVVKSIGWQNNPLGMRDFFTACDVFLMPSLAESFGLMSIEAMSASKPVVIFDNTALYEITAAPDIGVSVPYKDSQGLAQAIEHLRVNPNERLIRGELGKKLVETQYSYRNYINAHIQLYTDVFNRHNTDYVTV